ncbi:MAG TPA: hypothetical protein PK668_20805 [Myxococcota bacterium]|nr:hypothetical protein [Myxococcota bacterium]HRY96648.1 hypothetical protein [Myxococcota bacterium]
MEWKPRGTSRSSRRPDPHPANTRGHGDRLFAVRLFYREPTYELEQGVARVEPYRITLHAWGRDAAAALSVAEDCFRAMAVQSSVSWQRILVGHMCWEVQADHQ